MYLNVKMIEKAVFVSTPNTGTKYQMQWVKLVICTLPPARGTAPTEAATAKTTTKAPTTATAATKPTEAPATVGAAHTA